jgi:hypothetical protein
MTSKSEYEALLASPIPRDARIVAPYVRRATGWIRKTALIFAAFFIGFWLLISTLDASGGHSGAWWMSFVKGLGIAAFLSLFVLGPVLLFWNVNRTRLLRLTTDGRLLPASVSARGTMNIRGNDVQMATVSFVDETGRHRDAKFQGPPAAPLRVGHAVHVLRSTGDTVAVLWAPDALVLARLS